MTHKVFVSYHHAKDQWYAEELRDFYSSNDTLIDRSLPEEIDSDNDEYILGRIRSEHLKDSTVTIVLIGELTWSRKWVDWEIHSSLRPYGSRTINGLLGIVLPTGKRMPSRFEDNFEQGTLFGRYVQTKYAKLVSWSDIAPPAGWRTFGRWNQEIIKERRQYLTSWIDAAFENRNRPELICNSRPRMKKDSPAGFSWW